MCWWSCFDDYFLPEITAYCLVRIGNLLPSKQSRSDECFVDYVAGFLETMIRKRRDAPSRQCYSKRRTEKLKTPDVKTERWVRSFGRPIPDISRRSQTSIEIPKTHLFLQTDPPPGSSRRERRAGTGVFLYDAFHSKIRRFRPDRTRSTGAGV